MPANPPTAAAHPRVTRQRGRTASALALVAALLAVPAAARAQARDSLAAADTVIDYASLPRDIAREVRDVADAPGTVRVYGDSTIAAGSAVTTDVLALGGTLTIAGTVSGRVVAVNADLVFEQGASVGGDVLVVHGTVTGQSGADLGGAVRVYAGSLRDLVAIVRSGTDEWRWLRRWRERDRRNGSEITLTTGRTYNRVEGLPILVGPTLRQRIGGAQATLRAFGIVRTAHGLSLTSGGAGHLVTGEARLGGGSGVVLGGSSFDVVDAVETWQMPADEVGLASLFLHRDFRDYFNRHGAEAHVALFAGPDADFTVSLSDQRWQSLEARDPFTLFRNTQRWRANPSADEGRFHVANVTARFDTRNTVNNPWAGWYLVADYERGSGRVSRFAPASLPRDTADARTRYGRGFLEVRRYNRLRPDAQLNLRLVVGGWLDGDPLPAQRRFSVGGPATLPGFDFRDDGRAAPRLSCGTPGAAPPGTPAECDRVALAQVEYRGDLHLNVAPFSGAAARSLGLRHGVRDDAAAFRSRLTAKWVLFFDAGRGWRVGPRGGDARYPSNAFPGLGTFESDVGLGLLFAAPAGFDQLGVYVAKAVSDGSQPANVFVRIRRRF